MTKHRDEQVSRVVLQHVQKQILSGDLQLGDRLPSEREWSETLGVSRQSVREALRTLEVMGLVEMRPRSGTYVSGAELRQAFLPTLLRLRAGNRFLPDVMELRRVLEPSVSALAAERMDDAHLERIRTIHAKLAEQAEGGEAPTELDAAFHLAIAQATQNNAIAALMATLEDVFAIWRQRLEVRGASRKLGVSRAAIVNALERRDSQAAWAAMLIHLDDVAASMEEPPLNPSV